MVSLTASVLCIQLALLEMGREHVLNLFVSLILFQLFHHANSLPLNRSDKNSLKYSYTKQKSESFRQKVYVQAEKFCKIFHRIVNERINYLKNVEDALSNSVSALFVTKVHFSNN